MFRLKYAFSALVWAIFILLPILLTAQLSNYKMTGATKISIDTLALETSQKIIKESAGLLEKEIDPQEYIVGPEDEFIIFILSGMTQELEVTISPQGMLVVPEAGIIDLKNKTLAEAEKIVKKQVSKYYKAADVYFVLKNIRKFKVVVSGQIQKPASVASSAVDRVSEVIDKAGGLKYDASLRHIKLIRNNEIINVDLVRFFYIGDNSANPTVLGGDHIIVPPSNENSTIEISGAVTSPDKFEYVDGDSLSTIIKFAQGFLKSSLVDSVEIARYIRKSAGIERWFVNLSSWKDKLFTSNELPGDFPLEAGDRVFVRDIPDWVKDRVVFVEGEVQYPGQYAINQGKDRLSDVLERAGGVTDVASLETAVLLRLSELKKEDQTMTRLRAIPPSEMSENEKRYYQSRVSEIRGLMAVNFKRVLKDYSSDDNVLLMHEDSIFIPQQNYFINVQGRVNNPGIVVYRPGYTYMDYITLAGGFGFRADEDLTIVVKPKGNQFLASDMNYVLEPGDYILVPPESEISTYEFLNVAMTVFTQLVTVAVLILTLLNTGK